jgi:DNA-binding SARP family transcriptional activator
VSGLSATGVAQQRRHPHSSAAEPLRLQLLDSFALLRREETVALPPSVQRLVVFVTVHDRLLLRSYVAGALWPETGEQSAGANLRSALWRLSHLSISVIEAKGLTLRLAPGVRVDLRERMHEGQRLLETAEPDVGGVDDSIFRLDLLPDWYDDWLVIERERFHQLRLRVLECVCDQLTAQGEYARALDAGLAAVAGEPLRESAHRALVKVHLAEGNHAEAVRQYRLYRRLLEEQLGLTPSMQMLELLRA